MLTKNEKKTIRSLEQKKYRKQHGLFVVEGWKSVDEFLKHHTPTLVITTNPDKCYPCRTEIVSEEELRSLSFQQHPQETIALFRLPENTENLDNLENRFSKTDSRLSTTDNRLSIIENRNSTIDNRLSITDNRNSITNTPKNSNLKTQTSTLLLALDGVQDPGNLGTIIRLADWFGIEDIVCSPDTADAYNPKTVQATMGSLARVRVTYTDLPQWLRSLPSSTPIYGTLLDGENIYRQQLSTTGGVIVMGNEGKGLSPEVRSLVTKKLLIPSFAKGDTAESLNVAIATAIVCSEFRRAEG